MRKFADLYAALDETTKTNEKVSAMSAYFAGADPADAAWAVYFLSGRKPRQIVPRPRMRELAAEVARVPDWLFDESRQAVGDLAETMALLVPGTGRSTQTPLHIWMTEQLLPLRNAPEATQKAAILQAWSETTDHQRFVLNKLITGAFRVGVSQRLLVRALAESSGIDRATIAHRLMGTWEPTPAFYRSLVHADGSDTDISRPYPFFLAHQLDGSPEQLGDLADWQVEWKWDGIRAQAIRRTGETYLWSRGEELITDSYPEIAESIDDLPDGTVIDGEILPWREGAVRPFAELQRRIGRKSVGKKLLMEVPVILLAYDLLELGGQDIRKESLADRRKALEGTTLALGPESAIQLSPLVQAGGWDALAEVREESRDRNVEGFMLKRISSPYRVGRQRGDWWKWKIDPYTVDAVLIYAQRGSGRRASLYTDYTFGVWDDGELVPFAKAYSGLTNEEIREVDRFVRQNTIERFGPVRAIRPELVFELAFEGIQHSNRHKSGVAVRFPRMARWRRDKPAGEADTLANVKALLEQSVRA